VRPHCDAAQTVPDENTEGADYRVAARLVKDNIADLTFFTCINPIFNTGRR
jgi:hypothetical protein